LSPAAPAASQPVLPPPRAFSAAGETSPHPLDDLAVSRPGAAIRAELERRKPRFWRGLLDRVLGRPSTTESWRKGLAGEEKMAAELRWLTRHGWYVLHSIPLPRDVDIDHLLIGPGGVFTFNTKYHANAQVWVGDEMASVNGKKYPYARKARAEAKRAAAVLSRACGFEVRVEAVLAFVEPATLSSARPRAGVALTRVHTIRHDQTVSFGNLPMALLPNQVEQVYVAARDRRTWLNA
jgi:hypothetical protein